MRLFTRPRPPPRPSGTAPVVVLSAGVEAGGKGRGLVTLQEAGLAVPPTVVVPVACFREVVRALGAPSAREVRDAPVPTAWSDAWIAAARALGPRVVVRSSALAEDGRERSFAGVHTTVIGVAPEGVPDAVRRVWASAFEGPATVYGDAGGMAVLLQPLVEPVAAGVVFTINPQTGSWREMVVEAVRGQGEALVSGRQAPQWAIVRRSRHRAARGLGLRVLDAHAVPQPVTWTVDTRGDLVSTPTPAGSVDGELLGEDALRALCRAALKAERALGEPVDVEWAWDGERFWFLQARPITRAGAPRSRDVLWTRRFLGERLPSPPTPMTWSILAPTLEHFIGYPDVSAQYLGGAPPLRRLGGHAYLNVTVFRHLLFKWPGAPAPSFMLELLPPDEADAFRRSYRVRPDWAVYVAIFRTTFEERRWERFAWDPFTNPAAWEALAPRMRATVAELDRPVAGARDALDRVGAHVDLLRDYLAVHVCSLLFANLAYQLLHAALAAWVDGSTEAWMARLAVSEEGNATLALNHDLARLARNLGPEGRGALARDEVPEAARDFLARYGSRAEASWEVFSARWRDRPSLLVPLLDSAPPPGRSPDAAALADVLAGQSAGRQAVLRALVRYTRRYLLLRENQRFELDALMAGLQRALVALGEAVGLPAEDVPFATLEELRGLALGEVERPPVEARRAEHLAADPDPAVFLRGDEPADQLPDGRRLQGLGISAGRVRGRVRVLFGVGEAHTLEDGEILVAPAVDPGWTPLLGRAGGLVLELGSLLSHGAVIAREYGVPGVVNLAGVTRTLRTGMEVTVDGSRGTVWIHDP